MKKLKKIFALAITFALCLSMVACGNSEDTTIDSEQVEPVETLEVAMLDNDYVTLEFSGYTEEDNMVFWVCNKTGETINVYFSYVSLDGVCYEANEEVEVAGSGNYQVELVDVGERATTFSGMFVVEDEEYDILGMYEILDIALEDDQEEVEEFALDDDVVLVLSNDEIDVYYIGCGYSDDDEEEDESEPCLFFQVYNKTEEFIHVAVDTITVDGEEYEPSYIMGLFAGCTGTLYCDMEEDVNPEEVTELTCTFGTYDVEEMDLETYDVEGIALK